MCHDSLISVRWIVWSLPVQRLAYQPNARIENLRCVRFPQMRMLCAPFCRLDAADFPQLQVRFFDF